MNAYERDPYLTELEVRVVAHGDDERGPYLVFDDTVLYPEGGGQPADHGAFGPASIGDVRRVDDEVRHYATQPVDETAGVLRLDWRRRFDHMQQHTAQHLITAIADDELGWRTTSFHLGARSADIELDAEALDAATLRRLEDRANEIVREGRAVTSRRVAAGSPDLDLVRTRGLPEGHTGDVRLVEIAGLDRNTCAGTHVASTAEIGAVKLLGCERMRGGTRLFWLAGDRVLERIAEHEQRTAAMREIFETSDAELIDSASAKLDRLKSAEQRIRRLESELAAARADALIRADAPVHDAHFDDGGAALLQTIARHLIAGGDRRPGLLTATDAGASFFVVVAPEGSHVDSAELGPRIAELLGGRGGGSGDLFQGKAGSLAARREAIELLTGPDHHGGR